ncbi:MAG: hypothetical protein M9907_00020 [Burkholderiaceae bacterium]|nr:hypothetical protein [Burkholderiaceae bacterium]
MTTHLLTYYDSVIREQIAPAVTAAAKWYWREFGARPEVASCRVEGTDMRALTLHVAFRCGARIAVPFALVPPDAPLH